MSEDQSGCGLCLVLEAGDGASARLAAALCSAPVASVLIEAGKGAVLDAEAARPLVEIAHKHDIAALIDADFRLASALGAEGVHLPWSKHLPEIYDEARKLLRDGAIVGVHAGKSRHDAMLLAERGADYIGFGVPAEVKDREAARARRIELVAWWAEIFTIPCVAFDVDTPEDAKALAAAGADFVASRLRSGSTPADAAERLAAIARALGRPARAA